MIDFTIFYNSTGLSYFDSSHIIMIIIALIIMYIGIQKRYDALTLIPISFGMLFANIPGVDQMFQSINYEGTILNIFKQGLTNGIYPALIFIGIGAMTDFTSLIANPKLMFIGFAAQIGIFTAFMGALLLGFTIYDSATISVLGSGNAPVILFLTSQLNMQLMAIIGLTIYLLIAFVPIFQPPIIKLMTTPKERAIQMKEPRMVSQKERMVYPIIGFIITSLIAPAGAIFLGMFFLGNLLRECSIVKQLATTFRTVMIDICTILIGLCIGAMASGLVILNKESYFILFLGIFAFILATASGIIGAKFLNLFLSDKINPVIGAAGVSVIPGSAKLVDKIGRENNTLLLEHAMAPSVAGVIGSTVVAGVILGMLG